MTFLMFNIRRLFTGGNSMSSQDALAAIDDKYGSLAGQHGILGTQVSQLIQDTGAPGYHIDYQNGAIYWSQASGPHTLFGAIRTKWLDNGGPKSNFGYPLTDEASTQDGLGRFNLFEGGAIYWTSSSGACLIYGDIYKKWVQSGGESSPVGYPVSDETSTPDNTARFNNCKSGAIYYDVADGAHMIYGDILQKWVAQGGASSGMGIPITDETSSGDGSFRYNLFKNGAAICWTASTGAHMIYGVIYQKWMEIGGTATSWSLPITDETDCPDRTGRFNTLQDGAIYWTLKYGAFLIHGDILKKWLAIGGPNHWLGLPISDEEPMSDGGRMTQFERGVMHWHGSFQTMDFEPNLTVTTKDFTKPIVSGGIAALGGWVVMSIYANGLVRFRGDGHDSGLDGYQYGVTAVLSPVAGTLSPILAQVHLGSVGGTVTSGSRDDPWDGYSYSPFVEASFNDYLEGSFEVDSNYSSDMLGLLESAANFAVTWVGGSLLGSAVLVVFLGVEIGSLFTQGSLVPGARVFNGILWLAGPEATILAIIAEGIVALGSRERQLTIHEYEYAQTKLFKTSLPPIEDIVLTDTYNRSGPVGRAFTLPRPDGKISVNIGPAAYDDPCSFGVSTGNDPYGQVFLHELTHVWQITYMPIRLELIFKALGAQLQGSSSYDYGAPNKPFPEFPLEAQAQITADWAVGYARPGTQQTGNAGDVNSPYYKYIIDNIWPGNYYFVL